MGRVSQLGVNPPQIGSLSPPSYRRTPTTHTSPNAAALMSKSHAAPPSRHQGQPLSTSTKHNLQSGSSTKSHKKTSTSGPADTKKYKTEMCKSFASKGHCPYGAKCQFAHG